MSRQTFLLLFDGQNVRQKAISGRACGRLVSEPDAGEFWRADMGPVLAPFRNRMEALAAEREWLETTTGFDTAR